MIENTGCAGVGSWWFVVGSSLLQKAEDRGEFNRGLRCLHCFQLATKRHRMAAVRHPADYGRHKRHKILTAGGSPAARG